jgi:hypothetical protein
MDLCDLCVICVICGLATTAMIRPICNGAMFGVLRVLAVGSVGLPGALARSIHEVSSRGQRGADASRVVSPRGAEAYVTDR